MTVWINKTFIRFTEVIRISFVIFLANAICSVVFGQTVCIFATCFKEAWVLALSVDACMIVCTFEITLASSWKECFKKSKLKPYLWFLTFNTHFVGISFKTSSTGTLRDMVVYVTVCIDATSIGIAGIPAFFPYASLICRAVWIDGTLRLRS